MLEHRGLAVSRGVTEDHSQSADGPEGRGLLFQKPLSSRKVQGIQSQFALLYVRLFSFHEKVYQKVMD